MKTKIRAADSDEQNEKGDMVITCSLSEIKVLIGPAREAALRSLSSYPCD